MRKIMLVTLAIVLESTGLFAQSVSSFKIGTIEFERTQNIPAAFNHDPAMQRFVERMGSDIYKSFFTLTITKAATNYEYSKQNGPLNKFDEMPADKNQVYENLVSGQKLIKKSINGKTYTMTGDSLPVIQWKLTGEHKEIAGVDCRRANGLLFDSIYVVAFFSEKFPVSSGPENFRGLPGVILGISIPNEHIAWFATKITQMETPVLLEEPKQENLMTYEAYNSMLLTRIARIPKFGSVMYKRALF